MATSDFAFRSRHCPASILSPLTVTANDPSNWIRQAVRAAAPVLRPPSCRHRDPTRNASRRLVGSRDEPACHRNRAAAIGCDAQRRRDRAAARLAPAAAALDRRVCAADHAGNPPVGRRIAPCPPRPEVPSRREFEPTQPPGGGSGSGVRVGLPPTAAVVPRASECTSRAGRRGGRETASALRVLETSHPPTYYLPASAFRDGALRPRVARHRVSGRARLPTST